MNSILHQILELVVKQEVLISDHGYDELAEDDILVRDVIAGVGNSVVVEEYPSYPRDRVFWCSSGIMKAAQFMFCGGFRAMRHRLRLSSPRTGLTRSDGLKIS